MLKTTNNLIAHEYVEKIIATNSISKEKCKKNLLVFKNSVTVEEHAKRLGVRLLASSANVSRKIENKVNFYRRLQDEDINLLPGEIIVMTDNIDYKNIVKKYGETFVLQASKGFAGNKTFLVRSTDEFDNVKNAYKKRPMRLTKYIPGATLTINACATSLGTLVKTPFFQLTGFDGLTRNQMGTCGNDFYIQDIQSPVINNIIDCTKRVGDIIYQKGFRGLFGVDYIISNDKFYFIECNPRFVTSLPIFTRLEMINGEPPLVAFHILENMGKIGRVRDVFNEFKTPANNGYSGSQIIMHNMSSKTRKIRSNMKCGIYGFNGESPVFVREGYKIDDIADDDEFLIIPKPYGNMVNSGIECARIVTKKRALCGSELTGRIKRLVNNLYPALIE
jgi:hypothetical protein